MSEQQEALLLLLNNLMPALLLLDFEFATLLFGDFCFMLL